MLSMTIISAAIYMQYSVMVFRMSRPWHKAKLVVKDRTCLFQCISGSYCGMKTEYSFSMVMVTAILWGYLGVEDCGVLIYPHVCGSSLFPPRDLVIFVQHRPCQVPPGRFWLKSSCWLPAVISSEEEMFCFRSAAMLTGVHKCWISVLINQGMSLNLWIPPKGREKRHKKRTDEMPPGRREENKQLLNLLVKGRYFPQDS